jgi:hypothetical protein
MAEREWKEWTVESCEIENWLFSNQIFVETFKAYKVMGKEGYLD